MSLELLVKMTSKCIKHQPDGLLQSAIFYPLTEKCYITVSPTVNYSGDHTLEYLKEVFSPEVGVEYGTLKEPVGLVLDAFRGHFDKKF